MGREVRPVRGARGSLGEMWSELSSMRKRQLRSCQVRSEAGAFECLCCGDAQIGIFFPTVSTYTTKKWKKNTLKLIPKGFVDAYSWNLMWVIKIWHQGMVAHVASRHGFTAKRHLSGISKQADHQQTDLKYSNVGAAHERETVDRYTMESPYITISCKNYSSQARFSCTRAYGDPSKGHGTASETKQPVL